MGLLGYADYKSILLAKADSLFRENTLQSLRESARLDPGNASYHELTAEHEEAAGIDPEPDLEAAAQLSPSESRYWIRLSFRAESRSDFPAAEHYLLEAVKVDRKFDPKWALANYYFRQRRQPEFWQWVRQAFDMSYGDRTAIFRLCWEMTDDAALIEQALPARRDILADYLAFLMGNRRLEPASSIAQKLALQADPDDMPQLLQYCDRLINKDRSSALAVWNTLCRRKLLRFSALAPDAGAVVTNGDFSFPRTQQGFDWHSSSAEGVLIEQPGENRGVSITMSGQEPEDLVLLMETIPLAPDKEYQFDFEYRSSGSEPLSGLVLEIGDQSTELVASDGWREGSLRFAAKGKDIATLGLHYKRTSGAVRWNGTIALRRISAGLAK